MNGNEAAFVRAVREEMDSLYESAARAEARFWTGKLCPTEEEIQVHVPWCRAMLEAMGTGKIPLSGGEEDGDE